MIHDLTSTGTMGNNMDHFLLRRGEVGESSDDFDHKKKKSLDKMKVVMVRINNSGNYLCHMGSVVE